MTRSVRFLSLLVTLLPCFAQTRVFIISDAEGVTGVCHQEQTEPKGTDMPELLTGDVNAAVEGFLAGGADEVIVWDGHGAAKNLSAVTIHPKAKLIMGGLPANLTLDRKYTAIAFVGQHAMGNALNAIMGHSYSSLGIQDMRLNGKPVGEIETRVALAGQYGTPVIFLSGDQAAADELKAIVPDAELAVVKRAILRNSCETLSAQAGRDLIRDGARKSMAKIGKIKPYTVPAPVTLEIEYTTRNSINSDARLIPDVKVLDDRTIRYTGTSMVDVWTRYRTAR